jgi:hypothetical protein
MDIQIQIGIGEAYDRLTILEIKLERINDSKKLENISNEYDYLVGTMATIVPPNDEDGSLLKSIRRLKEVNEELWDLEDALREYEKDNTFNEAFIKMARNVYKFNDERAFLKKTISQCHNSYFMEEKSYE